jgi:hypothetical protein
MLQTGLAVNTQHLKEALQLTTDGDGVGLFELDLSLAKVRFNRPLNHLLSIYRSHRIVAANVSFVPYCGYSKHNLVQAVEDTAPVGQVLRAATESDTSYSGTPVAFALHHGTNEHDRYHLTAAAAALSEHPTPVVASYSSLSATTHGAIVAPEAVSCLRCHSCSHRPLYHFL